MVYPVTTFIKFLLFYKNFGKVCGLIKDITSKIREPFVNGAREAIKFLKIFAGVTTLSLMITPIIYFPRLTSKPLEIMKIAIEIMSGFYCDFTNSMLQFIYMNFCIQICSLFEQLKIDLEAIKPTQNEKAIIKSVAGIVETHQEILEIVSKAVKIFESILSFNFVVNIGFIAQTLILSTNSNWLIFLMSTPYLLVEAWIFCFASQKVITKVSF